MIFLALVVLFNTGFLLLWRASQRKGCNVVAVGAINFAVGGGLYAAFWMFGARPSPVGTTTLLGLAGGTCYAVSFLIMSGIMAFRGAALTLVASRVGFLVPVAVSIIAWSERPSQWQGIGILFALAALPLVGLVRTSPEERHPRRLILGLMAALLVTNGGGWLAIKGFQMTHLPAERALYWFIHFGTAAVVTWAGWGLGQRGLARRDLVFGLGLGLCNASDAGAMLLALEALPASVVFPVRSTLTLALVTLFATFVWREPLGRLGALGVGLVLVANGLIQIG